MEDFNEADVMFMQNMIEHHTMALDMTKSIYEQGKNAEVKILAVKIHNAQLGEIEEMKSWLKAHNQPEASSAPMDDM